MNSDDAEELLYTPPTKKDCKNQRDDVFNLNNNILHHVNNGQPINEDDKLLLPSAQDSIIICLSHNNNEMQTASTTEDNYTQLVRGLRRHQCRALKQCVEYKDAVHSTVNTICMCLIYYINCILKNYIYHRLLINLY